MRTTQFIPLLACLATQIYAFNLPKQPVKSYDCDVCTQLSHENLQDKWVINNQSLQHTVNNTQKSYSYKRQITMEELREGITISTLAPGAVVRITPLHNKTIPELTIKTPENKLLSLKDASSLYSEDQNFGAMETINQTMLQIKPELGFGKFVIKTDDTKHKNTDTFALNVFDKFSMTYLEVGTESLHYQYGDKVVATIALKNDDSGYEVDNVDAYLVGPASQIIPLELTEVTPHRFQGSATLLSELNDHGENWYVEANIVSSTGVDIIRRSGHAAFSYSVPSAALLSIVKLTSKPLTFVATIDVATPSRYALQSVLFSQSGSGEPKAIETSQKAQWFDAGKHVIQFTFDNANNLIEDKLYLGYLRLIDYGQLKTVYQYNAPIKLSKLVE